MYGSRALERLLVVAGCVFLLLSGLCLGMHLRNSRYLLRATASIWEQPGDEEAHAKALSHLVAVQGGQPVEPDSASLTAKLEHSLPLELSPVTVLKEGFAFPNSRRFGPCGQLSRTVRAVGWLRGIPSHKVLMGEGKTEHAMVALYVNGGYRLFDPTYDFYWTDASGHVATVDEVRNDPKIFAQVYARYPDYPYSLKDASYFNWHRLGAPGRVLRRLLVAVLGRGRVEQFDTPMLYDRPWWGYTWFNLGVAILCLAASRAVARRARAPEAAAREVVIAQAG